MGDANFYGKAVGHCVLCFSSVQTYDWLLFVSEFLGRQFLHSAEDGDADVARERRDPRQSSCDHADDAVDWVR